MFINGNVIKVTHHYDYELSINYEQVHAYVAISNILEQNFVPISRNIYKNLI